ncbi:MAG TPA: hypothetical protein PKZ54_10645 [Syntrophorhabdaceae bacterium]|nr:hypothetical protein [Syntrophorhabdaceae bacterium]
MALSTFGAIIGFAAEIIEETKLFCNDIKEKTKNPQLKEAIQHLIKESEKYYSLMEKTKRENVTEMILEPITGFEKEDYILNLDVLPKKDDEDLIEILLLLLERERRFFEDASNKVSLPEVARILSKISRKKEETLHLLNDLRGKLST